MYESIGLESHCLSYTYMVGENYEEMYFQV